MFSKRKLKAAAITAVLISLVLACAMSPGFLLGVGTLVFIYVCYRMVLAAMDDIDNYGE